MKIIHCADIHLDSRMNTHLSKEKANERKNELMQTFQAMFEYAKMHKIEGILIAGDLFDRNIVSVTARNFVRGILEQYAEIRVFYLRGNHDNHSFLNGMEQLPENLYVFDREWKSYAPFENPNIVITAAELSKDNQNELPLQLVLDVNKLNIVALHGQEGAEIDLTRYKNKGIDYLALGHIHGFKRDVLDPRAVYCYSGCLEGRGFDECGEHGFVVLDIDEALNTVKETFVPFSKRILHTVNVDVAHCMTTLEMVQAIESGLSRLQIPEKDLVKLQLTGAVDVEAEKNIDFIQKSFQDHYYFVKCKDTTKYRISYQTFEHDKTLKGEFIRTVMEQETLSGEEKAAIIHMGLRALMGEELIVNEAASL